MLALAPRFAERPDAESILGESAEDAEYRSKKGTRNFVNNWR
jgi:hypothetical protein